MNTPTSNIHTNSGQARSSQAESDLPVVDPDEPITLVEAAMESFQRYAKQKPENVVLCALGIGFLLGWKLKPW